MRVYGTKSKILQHSEALFRSLEEQGTQNCFYDGGCLWLPMPALAGPGSQSVLREARPCDVMRESSRSSCSGVICCIVHCACLFHSPEPATGLFHGVGPDDAALVGAAQPFQGGLRWLGHLQWQEVAGG